VLSVVYDTHASWQDMHAARSSCSFDPPAVVVGSDGEYVPHTSGPSPCWIRD